MTDAEQDREAVEWVAAECDATRNMIREMREEA